jgi:hypothetical protein
VNAYALDLLRGALALPLDERAELVAELLASLDGEEISTSKLPGVLKSSAALALQRTARPNR